jgi:hypothetical protein
MKVSLPLFSYHSRVVVGNSTTAPSTLRSTGLQEREEEKKCNSMVVIGIENSHDIAPRRWFFRVGCACSKRWFWFVCYSLLVSSKEETIGSGPIDCRFLDLDEVELCP